MGKVLWFATHTTLQIHEDSINNDNLMISSLVGSGHLHKSWCEIPHEHLSRWRILSREIILIKRNQ